MALQRFSRCSRLALLTLIPSLAGAAPQGTGLAYQVPDGWDRVVDPRSGLVTIMPRGLPPGRVSVVSVFLPEPYTGPAAHYHDDIVRRATFNARPLETPQRGEAGGFLVTRVRQLMPNGIQLWVTIFTARWGDQGQALVFSANAADVEAQFLPTADAMVRRIAVPGAFAGPSPVQLPAPTPTPAAPPCLRPTGIEICPKLVPPPDQAVPITGAYVSASARSGFRVGAGVQSRVTTEIILLYANGVAVRTSAAKDGTDGTYWSEGIATMDPRDPSQLGARRVGQWGERGDTISIVWQVGPRVTLTKDGSNLREQHTEWTQYAPVDGLRLEGRYQRDLGAQIDIPGYQPTPQILTLRKDGTFTADGVDVIMGGSVVNPGFPEHGAGTYEIARWSLILRFTTGFVQSINLLLGEGDAADPRGLVLNGSFFGKLRP